jgi:hypothetical protein
MQAARLPHTRRPRGASAALLATSVAAFGLIGVVVPAVAEADPLPANCSGTTTVTCTFDYNGTDGTDGSPQTWTVPAGVTSAYVDVLGAQGSDFSPGDPTFGRGGLGGEASGTVALAPGSIVTVLVGGDGQYGAGYNGGAVGTSGGGGGGSEVRIGGAGLAGRVLVAGGGGGTSGLCFFPTCTVGGAGGGSMGGTGTTSPGDSTSEYGGAGGTQNGGGAGRNGAMSGHPGVGGAGGNNGGGGGGGYFGGAGGGGTPGTVTTGSGGGGSGFFHPDTTRVTGGSTVSGMREGHGLVTLRYTRASQTITFPALADRSIVESPFALSGVTGGGSGNPVTFTASGPCSVSGSEVTLSETGVCAITAHQDGDVGYQPAADVSRSFTITPPPALSIADRSSREGNFGTHAVTLPVTLDKAVSVSVTVHWSTVGSSAKAPSDFAATSGTLTFAPGQTSRTVSVTVKGDRQREPSERFAVRLTDPTNATIADGFGVATIVNDD